MPKKKRKSSTHKTTSHKSHDLEETLVKNLVQLQKIHTELAEKFNKMSNELSHLLALFEVTARNFAKNAPIGEYEKDKDFLEKIDKLLEQNKTLAKGLVLMEERLRERMYGATPQSRPSPGAQQRKEQENSPKEEGFQPSIASGNRPLPRF